MGKQKELREVDKAFIHAVMFELGIIPMERTDLDMRRALKQLPPEESRALKRKFRKLWRKAMRAEVGAGGKANVRADAAKRKYGTGKRVPSRAERNARKELVFKSLWTSTIEPMLRRFYDVDGRRLEEAKRPEGEEKASVEKT